MNYVIIGNSTAAVGCIEQIRKTDQKGKITVISDEPYHTYGRPLISYYLLGRVDAAHMNYRPADFYEKNGVKTLLGVRAERIDPAAKKVFLQGGKSVPYDKLLVATGSRPFVPPMDGYDTVKEKFTFMTFADALALEQALSPEMHGGHSRPREERYRRRPCGQADALRAGRIRRGHHTASARGHGRTVLPQKRGRAV